MKRITPGPLVSLISDNLISRRQTNWADGDDKQGSFYQICEIYGPRVRDSAERLP